MKLNRRFALKSAALLAAGMMLPAWVRARVAATFPTRTVEGQDFRFDPDQGTVVMGGKAVPFALTIDGLVERPLSLTYAELKKLPQKEQVSDFHCVEGWDVLDVHWGGIMFKDLLALAHPRKEATYAVFHSLGRTRFMPRGQDHYIESFPISDLLDPKQEMLLALRLEGQPLPQDRGAPMRVVCPNRLAYKSIKFVTRIELRDKPQPGWWTLANPIYSIEAGVEPGRLRRK